ncbi:MAG TPA: glycoside hydrolase family 2 TIM barrel-domain containing protein, partial [Bacteroidales bacterium]
MNYKVLQLITFLSLFNLVCISAQTKNNNEARITESFDKDWRFLKADAAGAENPSFDDVTWRQLDVPHDWSIEGPFDKSNPTGVGGGYLPAGIGWYRKTFTLPDDYKNYLVLIEFDGVMANSDVWINGFHLGKRPYGYISFNYELTGHLNFGKGKTNVIAVRADNSVQPASRWYTGAGIYRHVRLVAKNPVHLKEWGVYVTTSKVSPDKASVKVQTTLNNQSKSSQNLILQTSLIGPDGKVAGSSETKKSLKAGTSLDVEQDIDIVNPLLWDTEQPNLYKVESKVISNKVVVDNLITPFGIRDAKFEAATGFWLNGKNLKIKGVCLHHDGGAVGTAVPLRVWERRLEILKQIGVNAIRTSHNPVAPEFLDLCDRMGFLVMDETFDTWTAQKKPANFGYQLYFKDWWEKDTRDMIMRDRNHPGIVIYSVGNEIHDNLDSPQGFKTFTDLRDLIHGLDTTRPVTMALFRPNNSHVYTNGLADLMDVVGQNYRENELVDAHNAKPERKVIGTENGHTREAWLALRDNPFMAGQFLWTGIDYFGESFWPYIAHGSGLLDRTGAFKPRGYERQSWWSGKPMVRIARSLDNSEILESDGSDGTKGISRLTCDWTPRNMDSYTTANVQVFSNCEEVELFLNGKSLGSQKRPADDSPRKWSFPFERGVLKAVGKNNGQLVATDELKTAGRPAKIILSADKNQVANDWDDVTYITATVTDSAGTQISSADNLIKFSISGPGKIVAVDNGNNASTEPLQ